MDNKSQICGFAIPALFLFSKKLLHCPTGQGGEISMSKTKTKNHQLYYEGLYWSSRSQYTSWVKAKRTADMNQKVES